MKKLKLFITTAIFLLLTYKITAKPIDNIKQFTLENGMEIFLLEDSSDALVHIEYACRGGISSQSRDNCGFFKLYTNLIKTNNESLNFTDVQCNQDSSRYFLTVTAPQTEYTLTKLADAVFAPQFSDEIITYELEKMQNEIKDTTEDMSKYINSAIESKVFADSPWKHDSGIYPPLFKQITPSQARVQIKNIGENWYTPQNSGLFITGNINIEKILVLIENTFGKYYSSAKIPEHETFNNSKNNKEKETEKTNKKFILHSQDLSPELTQVVVQYKTLNMTETDLLGEILNNKNSSFKNKLLSFPSLNILGDEYIDISSNHQRDNSRLIIQTLIQPPAKQTNKTQDEIETTSINQAIEFCTYIKEIPELITESEIKTAQNSLIAKIAQETTNPVDAMNSLSSFWAIAPYYQSTESDFQSYPDSITTSLMMSQIIKLLNIDFQKIIEKLESETPFVFVIINTEDYNKNKTAYTIAGFEEITPENASWYVQEMNKEIKNRLIIEEKPEYSGTSFTSRNKNNDNQYYEKNINLIKEEKLKNGITVVTKEKPDSADISLLISIKGGKLKTSEDNGFEEVMINILTSMIKNDIKEKQEKGIIKSAVEVSSETKLSTSSILIEFRKGATEEILKTVQNIIIYGEIPPATADKAVSHLRYQKRLSNGSVKNQMYSEVIKQLYGPGDLFNIFEAENEILTKTTYMSILSEYHSLLDTSRYSVIISGNFENNIIELLENTIGTISLPAISYSDNENNKEIAKAPSFPTNKKITMDLKHTFLTDTPAEEAGPQPAILVPTTEFLDPVMYVIEAPEFGTKDSALFKGMLKYLEKQLQQNIALNPLLEKCSVIIQLPENMTNFATIIFQNVSHISEIDSLYKSTLSSILDNLSIQQKKEITLQNIKDNWTLTQLQTTNTNTGTVKLIQEGFEQFSTPNPAFYLEQYSYIQQATVRDFEKIINYLIAPVKLKIYSTSSKL